jgi:hypothetical protein
MVERSLAGVGVRVFAGGLLSHGDALGGALMDAGSTAVASDGVDNPTRIGLDDGVEAADRLDVAALHASVIVDDRHRPDAKRLGVQPLGAQHQLQVGRVDIGIGQDDPIGKGTQRREVGEGRGDTGLSHLLDESMVAECPAFLRHATLISVNVKRTYVRLTEPVKECAGRMGISRTTFSRTLAQARRKVTDALINGKRLVVDPILKIEDTAGAKIGAAVSSDRPGDEIGDDV